MPGVEDQREAYHSRKEALNSLGTGVSCTAAMLSNIVWRWWTVLGMRTEIQSQRLGSEQASLHVTADVCYQCHHVQANDQPNQS